MANDKAPRLESEEAFKTAEDGRFRGGCLSGVFIFASGVRVQTVVESRGKGIVADREQLQLRI